MLDSRLHRLTLRPETPLVDIRRRLGWQDGSATPGPAIERVFERTLARGLSLCQGRAAWRAWVIAARTRDRVTFADDSEIRGTLAAKLLHGCVAVLAMAATVGPEITAAIQEELTAGHAAEAVILDAVGSEMADAVVAAIQERQAHALPPCGYTLTRRRISPGFGDFNLEQQAWFVQAVDLPRLGLTLTPASQLVPEKSVTAIAGIRETYRTDPHRLGLRPGSNLDNIHELIARLEGEDHR
jgi:hypothetical protein